MSMKDRHSKVGPEELARKWNIGLQTAKDTLEATTQHGVRNSSAPDDATVVSRPPAPASDIPERHVVCRHAHGEGKVTTQEHMC